MERRTLDSCENKRKLKTPQAKRGGLSFLPAESECLERNGTNWFLQFDHIKKQQSIRKQPKLKKQNSLRKHFWTRVRSGTIPIK